MKTLIILPTYNEAENLQSMCRTLSALPVSCDLLIVDDNSSDGTKEQARQLTAENQQRIFLIERPGKMGLGTAYIAGFRFALEKRYDYVFEMDADFSHDPQDVPRLLAAMNDCDIALGSRYIGGIRIINWPMHRLMLSYGASIYCRILTGLKLHDCTSGFKCFSAKALSALPLDSIVSDGYSFQIEVNFFASRLGFKIKEIPIIFTERRNGCSKMSFAIAVEAVWLGIRLLFRRIF